MIFLRLFAFMIAVVLLLALGCHSAPLRSPKIDHEAEITWQKNYTHALANQNIDVENSCKIFKNLAEDKNFPPHDLARLRAFETCPAEEMPGLLDRRDLPAYLQDMSIDVMLKVAATRKDSVMEMQLAVEKSKQRLQQTEKIKWMKLAIERATDLNDQESLASLTRRLYAIAPRLNPTPKVAQYYVVANDLRMARSFAKSREYYELVLANPTYRVQDKINALKGIRLTYKNVRANEDHIRASHRLIRFLRKLVKSNPRSQTFKTALFDAEIYHARALWTLGHSREAAKTFDLLEPRMKGHTSLAELYWLKGRMAEESNNFDAVSKFLDLASREKTQDLELRDKILWYSAWNERRRKNLPKAIEVLREMDQTSKSDFTRARALYWLGRSLMENAQLDEGKGVYTRLTESDPLGYYGLLAHHQLALPITLSKRVPIHDAKVSSDIKIPLDTRLAQWLTLLGESDALTSLLDQASIAYRKQKAQNDEGWVQIFQHYARAGLYVKLYESLGNLGPEFRKRIFEQHPELLFPQPWQEDAQKAASKFGIEEDLIYAIIRQESAFDVHARSLADAFGVMQLLPEVAEQLSQRYKIPYSHMEDLYDPALNMLLGAAHLKELFTRQNGRFILAVASYNASENVIRNWMKVRYRGDSQEFIEDIPYEETRAYVRLVIRNLTFYNLLKSKAAQIEFPAWVLNLSSSTEP